MLRQQIEDNAYRGQLDGLATDGIDIFTLEDDSVRGALLSASRMLALMQQNHRLGILETLVLGQAYLAAGLLSVTIKGNDRLELRVEADGPAGGFAVSGTAGGTVRGRLFNHPFELDTVPDTLDTASLIGSGRLTMIRHLEGRTEPVYGTIALRTGRLAEDLSRYYLESEQLPTSFTLGIHFDRQGRVAGAGGLYLQAMPGTHPEILDRVERLVYSMPQLGAFFAEGKSRRELMLRMFPFFDLNMLEERPVSFACPCGRDRMYAYLGALPEAEREDIRENGPFPLEIVCHNCGSLYRFEREELSSL